MSLYNKLTEAEKAAIGEADSINFSLKPCPSPHCGSRRLYLGRKKQNAYCVECLDCGNQSVEGQTLQEAIEIWGRLKPSPNTPREPHLQAA